MKGVRISGRPLYLDVQATSPVDPRVLDAMMPFYVTRYGNPHSRTHLYGWESDQAVETARAQVASIIGASPKEIVFTSGATESNNISVKGVMHFYKEKKRHVITTQTEHKCVLDSCRHLQQEGFEITYLPVGSDGIIDLEKLRSSIRPDTGLVSVMAVNNEIGVIQPMEEIGQICKEFNVPFHTDAAQAVGKIPIDVAKWNVSLMSLSGHKIYGPKGVGALYMRRRPRIRVEPQMNGGGQERGIRSGTVPTPLVVGMGAACELAMKEMEYDEKRITALQQRMLNGIRSALQFACTDDVSTNVATAERLVRAAHAKGAKIILIQELFEGHYFCQAQREDFFQRARPHKGHPTILRMQKLARELGVVIPVSFFEEANNAHYNSIAIIDADGTDLGLYRKSHIPDGPGYQEKFYFNPGDTGFKVFPTKFAKIGVAICWDQWFPEAARAMVLQGAEILLYPTAIGSEPQDGGLDSCDHWKRVMQGHAGANIVPLIASNRIGKEIIQTEHGDSEITFYGNSFIAGPTGEIVVAADDKEEAILVAEFDLDKIKSKRKSWGVFRDRRPDLYKVLLTLDGSNPSA